MLHICKTYILWLCSPFYREVIFNSFLIVNTDEFRQNNPYLVHLA
jgi:hypothetical protein